MSSVKTMGLLFERGRSAVLLTCPQEYVRQKLARGQRQATGTRDCGTDLNPCRIHLRSCPLLLVPTVKGACFKWRI